MTASDPLSPELRRLVDEAGPGAYVARGRDVPEGQATEWRWAADGALWQTGVCKHVGGTVIVRPRRVTAEVPVDLLERLAKAASGTSDRGHAAAIAARRIIDEARSDTGDGT